MPSYFLDGAVGSQLKGFGLKQIGFHSSGGSNGGAMFFVVQSHRLCFATAGSSLGRTEGSGSPVPPPSRTAAW